jgi:diamine N-acetyltransferase
MENIKLKLASPEDIPIIYALAEKIWMHHYVPIIGREQVDYMLGKMYSSASLTEQMTEKKQPFYLILNDEIAIGFISVSGIGEMFIHKFYIDQDKQNKGLGTIVFNKMNGLFSNVKSYTLTVNRKNFKAINFYFKVGFIIDHIDDFDIGNEYWMNDFIMKWKKG